MTGHLFPCCMYRKTALQCVPTVHTDALSPFQVTFSNCMYRKTALQCVPTVHTDAISPSQTTSAICMYRKSASHCIRTVHTDWVCCVVLNIGQMVVTIVVRTKIAQLGSAQFHLFWRSPKSRFSVLDRTPSTWRGKISPYFFPSTCSSICWGKNTPSF